MIKIKIDFETYCDLNINDVGAYKYTDHPSCRVLCLGYRIDNNPTNLWIAGDHVPTDLKAALTEPTLLYAFNAPFDYMVWNKAGNRDYPEMFPLYPLSCVRDVRALCARYRMPQNLRDAGRALKCSVDKMSIGKKLIRKCCQPEGYPNKADFADLYHYCMRDVDVMCEIIDKLPADHLTPSEQLVWEQTFRMNESGVPIDRLAVQSIIRYLAEYMDSMKSILPEVSDGMVSTPGQIQKIKKFCAKYGLELDNLQADTVEKTLQRDDLSENVRTVLEIRQLTGLSSVKKFITIDKLYNNGVVQGNLNYHGAGTGRWSGFGFQYHNLPRKKHKDPDKWIEKFINFEEIEKPVEVAKGLIRPMIKAPKGYMLMVSDYSSIENFLLAWVNSDEATLKMLYSGRSQYIDMASYMYKIPYEDITKDMLEYHMGKQVILGCGYQMGHKRFRARAAQDGLIITKTQAEIAVDAYRTKYYLIKDGWKKGNNACKAAVRHPGKTFKALKSTFKVVKDRTGKLWLRITLPSGRAMMYSEPTLDTDKYGLVVKYWGLNSKTHQMTRTALTPGLITENIVQGAARDVLAAAQLRVEKKIPEIQLSISVHDECGGIIRTMGINEKTLPRFNEVLCEPEPWMDGLQLRAEGYMAERYRKD